eukprot:358814-Chlamydomonas_euryale.AAC.4
MLNPADIPESSDPRHSQRRKREKHPHVPNQTTVSRDLAQGEERKTINGSQNLATMRLAAMTGHGAVCCRPCPARATRAAHAARAARAAHASLLPPMQPMPPVPLVLLVQPMPPV